MTRQTSPKSCSRPDWHPADIVCALRKAGWSLSQLSIHHGYGDRSAMGLALKKPYPKAERIIATALGKQPQDIWPSRYDANGNPNRRRGHGPMKPANAPQPSIADMAQPRNTQRDAA